MNNTRGTIALFCVCYLIVLAIPVLIYMMIFSGVVSKSPAEARKILVDKATPSALIDVRQPGEFTQKHIHGAVNRPFDEILSLQPGSDFFREYKDHTLFFICSAGFSSATAVKKMTKYLTQPVFNVSGGMQKWPEGAAGRSDLFFGMISENRPPQSFPEISASIFAQLAACAAAFAIKPLYMILALILILYLRKNDSLNGRALLFSMIFFLTGESFCALNYLLFGEDSCLIEYLHIAGMVAAFGFVIFAAFQFIDVQLMNLSDRKNKCSAINLCGSCYKYFDVSCRFTQVFAFVCISLMICSTMPLLASTRPESYNTDIFGTMYNYGHPIIFQYFEIRFAPIAAMIFFGLSFLIYWKKRFTPSSMAMLFFSAGAGMLGFSFFRLFLFAVYAENLWWYIIWEEITELLFIAGVCLLMWIFRKRPVGAS